jgi:hypothetical protein
MNYSWDTGFNLCVFCHSLELYHKFFVDNAASDKQIKALELENDKLQAEVATFQSKLEMQQHHAGGLGAAMLQERLEAQQRHIAVLELAKKVSHTKHCGCTHSNPCTSLLLPASLLPSMGEIYLVMLSLVKIVEYIVSGK